MNTFVNDGILEEVTADLGVGQPVTVRLITQRKQLDNGRLGRKFATVEVTIGEHRPIFVSPDSSANLLECLKNLAPEAQALAAQIAMEAEQARKEFEEKRAAQATARKTVRTNTGKTARRRERERAGEVPSFAARKAAKAQESRAAAGKK